MNFSELPIAGAFFIDHEPFVDERGSFARTFCRDEFARHGLIGEFVQSAVSRNPWSGTLRGLHFQRAPCEEVKLVRCTAGEIFDVIIDLRPTSRSFRRWYGMRLSSADCRSVYVPKGCAHGYLTLVDDSCIAYQISQSYQPDHATGVRWDDAAFAIQWPGPIRMISARDRGYPDFGS